MKVVELVYYLLATEWSYTGVHVTSWCLPSTCCVYVYAIGTCQCAFGAVNGRATVVAAILNLTMSNLRPFTAAPQQTTTQNTILYQLPNSPQASD